MANQLGAGAPALRLDHPENNQSIDVSVHCEQYSKLAKQFTTAKEIYSESILALIDVPEPESRTVFQRVLEAHSACEVLRSALNLHEQQHRCAASA